MSTKNNIFDFKYSCILAIDQSSGGIANHESKLPWHIPNDLQHFKKTTMDSVVIMGYRTYKSLPIVPLPNRINIVIDTHSASEYKENDIIFVQTLNAAFEYAYTMHTDKSIFIIGGKQVIEECIMNFPHNMKHAYISWIRPHQPVQYSTFMQEFVSILREMCTGKIITSYIQNNCDVNVIQYTMIHNLADLSYFNLLKHILSNGIERQDRTNVGTRSLFGEKLTFDISDSIPLLTSKFVSFRNVVHELLFFLQGKTNINYLKENNVKIWNHNTSRAFLDQQGLTTYPEGELGPGAYPMTWRNFGGTYNNHSDIKMNGMDQIKNIIHLLRTDPYSRRILLSAWNPLELETTALVPCHLLVQFYVTNTENRIHEHSSANIIHEENNSGSKHLSCMVTMRSCDVFLGLPYNIASYSILTYMLAQICNMKPNKLIMSLGDTHIYNNHIDQAIQQLNNGGHSSPTLILNKERKEIDDFTFEDFKLCDYKHDGIITAPLN
jgi:thymidylate synthase/dihydrofolate reductase